MRRRLQANDPEPELRKTLAITHVEAAVHTGATAERPLAAPELVVVADYDRPVGLERMDLPAVQQSPGEPTL